MFLSVVCHSLIGLSFNVLFKIIRVILFLYIDFAFAKFKFSSYVLQLFMYHLVINIRKFSICEYSLAMNGIPNNTSQTVSLKLVSKLLLSHVCRLSHICPLLSQ